jgi:hypothetical protein
MNLTNITDLQRLEFMQKLCDDVRRENGLVLDDWEQQFLASFTSSSRPSLWFTAGRQIYTDRMWMKYGGELKHPFPADDVRPQALPVADAAGCEVFVRDESRRQVRCNAPATQINLKGMRYCDACAERVTKDLKQLNLGSMILNKIEHRMTKSETGHQQ